MSPSLEKVWDSIRQGMERIYQRPDTFSRTCLVSMYTYVLCSCNLFLSDQF